MFWRQPLTNSGGLGRMLLQMSGNSRFIFWEPLFFMLIEGEAWQKSRFNLKKS
jgi:hypothetical protein